MPRHPAWWWVALGLLVVVALAAAYGLSGKAERASRPTSVAASVDAELVAAMLAANDALRSEMEELDRQIAAASSRSGAGRLESMTDTLNSLRITNSAVAAEGPGVDIRVSGGFSAATIRDLVNELKSGGAEAVAVNGHRLTLWSAIYQSGDLALLDGYDLGDVVTITAIGDPATLTEVLDRRGGIVAVAQLEGVVVDVTPRFDTDGVRMPRAREQKAFTYAHAP